MDLILFTLLVGAGVAMVIIGAYHHLSEAVDTIEKRLGRYAGMRPSEIRDEVVKKTTHLSKTVNTFVNRQSFADRLRDDLQRADLKLTPGEFLFLRLGAVMIACLIAFILFQNFLIAFGAGVLGFFAVGFWLGHRKKARERRFNELLGDAVIMMSSGLRAGYSMMQALKTVSREMSAPINDEFHRVTMEVGVGISVEDALNHLVKRVKSVDLELMTIAMNVQREVGGNLAEILDTIAATIRERQELRGEVKTLTAQGRISAYIICALPVFLAVAMYFMNRAYVSVLWTTPAGYFMLAVAVTMMVIGFFVTRKVASVEV